MLNVSIARVIESAIGRLSLELISDAERHPVAERGKDISESIKDLVGAISMCRDSRKLRDDAFIRDLKIIIKSTNVKDSASLLVFLSRRFPAVMAELCSDRVIGHRINHAKKLAEIGYCVSVSNIQKLDGGVAEARRRILKIQTSIDASGAQIDE
nr:hypothetical protein [Ferrovum sp.]